MAGLKWRGDQSTAPATHLNYEATRGERGQLAAVWQPLVNALALREGRVDAQVHLEAMVRELGPRVLR